MDRLKQKRNEIYENVPNIKFNENIMKETIKKINQTKETKELFELDTWEINIKRMNERIDTEKLDDLLNSNEIIPNSNAISSINDIENTILKLREIIIYDICKREKLIGELAENLNKEKEIFFKIEE
jgi:5S rRNA maturation endonuclease (ribonuclease M5)